jgi:hypothetical protein
MFSPRQTKKGRARAAAILLALWALFLLSAMVISWALDINTQLTLSSSANRDLEAEAMACSGGEVALHPMVKSGSPLLHGSFGSNQSFDVRITGEGGRLNLNAIAAAVMANPNSPARELLRKYLEVKGVDLNERDHMIDCLLDWVDPDNLVRLNGAEDDQGYQPANGPLKTLDEVKRIRGWEDFASQPDWESDFTLYSMNNVSQGNQAQPAQIDINSASRDVLLSLPGFSEPIVDRLLELRRGPDNIEGTEDDLQLTPDYLQGVLGVRLDQIPQLTGLITYDSAVKRVVSVGKSGSTTRTLRIVLLKINNGPSRLISWKEL